MANKRKKGMAMASVLCAMALFMVFGTLITATALSANTSVKLYKLDVNKRNLLNEIGEYFVAQVSANSASGSLSEQRQTIQTNLANVYGERYNCVVSASSTDTGATVYSLTLNYKSAEDALMYIDVQKDASGALTVVKWRVV